MNICVKHGFPATDAMFPGEILAFKWRNMFGDWPSMHNRGNRYSRELGEDEIENYSSIKLKMA